MSAPDRLIGQVLGEAYRLKRRVASGTMGMIYEAEDLPRSRRVAVKLLHPSLSRDAAALAVFRREAQTAGSLGHPHLAEFVDFSPPEAKGAYVVTELLEGEDLGARLQRVRRLGVRAAVGITREVLAALAAAHAAGVAHRDLKPTNVFLCRRGGRADFVKLVDFGLASLWAAPGAVTTTRPQGTARYLAPEQAKGRPAAADARADVWAAGVILYEMLAGAPAFAGPDRAAIVTRITEQAPTPLRTVRAEVRPELEAIVTRALAKAPGDRFASAGEMRQALAAAARLSGDWEDESPEAAEPLPPPPPPAALAALTDPFAEIHTTPQPQAPDSFKDPFSVMRTLPQEKAPRAVTRSYPPPLPVPGSGAGAPPPVPAAAAAGAAPLALLPHEPTMELTLDDVEPEEPAAPPAPAEARAGGEALTVTAPLVEAEAEPGLSGPVMRWWHNRMVLGIAAAGLLVVIIVVGAVLIGRGCSAEPRLAQGPRPADAAPVKPAPAPSPPADAAPTAPTPTAPAPASMAAAVAAPAPPAGMAAAAAPAAPPADLAAAPAPAAPTPAPAPPPASRPSRPAAAAPARRTVERDERTTGLPRDKVRAVMAPLDRQVKACFRNFNVTKGMVTLSVTVDPAGRVTKVATVGRHAGTPAGGCAATAARRVSFTSFRGKPVTINYSYDLR